MADDGKVGELWVGVGMDLKPMKRQAETELKKMAEEIGKEAAEAITEAMAFPITTPFPLGKALKKQAVASLQEVMGDLKKVADEKMAELREALSMGLINRSEFNRRGKEVAEAFSQGLDAKIQELGMQDRVSPALMQQVENVKQTGVDIGYQAGESIMAGLRRASDLQMADAKEAFARGLIDQEEFDKRGREAGQAFNNAVLAEIRKRAVEGTLSEDQFLFLTKQLKTAGIKGGDEFLSGVQHSTRIKMAKAKDALLRGLIDHKEFEKRGREAAEAANKAILDEIRKRVAAGTLKSKDFLALSDALKDTGAKGGKQFGQEATKGARSALGDLNKWLAGGFVVGALMAFTGLANRVIRMFQRVAAGIRDTLEAGGAARTVRSSFEAVAGSRGADPTAMLGELRKGLAGTASDMEIMRRATFALNAGLPATAEQMGELAYIARRLGEAVGKDATDSFQQLAEGIAKGRSQTLQELGIMTRRQDALRAWEKQTGRNSASLSEQEKVLIHLAAAMEEGREKVAAMGDESKQAATPVQQLGKFLVNLRNQTAEAVANSGPVVGMLTKIGDAAKDSAGEVQNLANHVGAYVATAVELSRKYGEGPARLLGRTAGFLARNMFGLDETTEGGRTFQKHLRLQEIQGETDLTKLAQMRRDAYAEIRDLEGQGVQLGDRRLDQLWDGFELIQERERALKPKPTTGGTGADYGHLVAALETAFSARTTELKEQLARELIDPQEYEEKGREAASAFNRGILSIIDGRNLTGEQRAELVGLLKDDGTNQAVQARKKIFEQLTDDVARLTETATQTALRELGKLEEKFRETFGGSIPAAAEGGLAKIRENIELGGVLEGFRVEYRAIQEMKPSPEALASLQALVARVMEQRDAVDKTHTRWKELDALLKEMEKRAKTSEAEALVAPFKAAFDQQMAQLREQLARGIIDRKEFERAGREAGKVLRDKILEEIEKLRASGALSDEVYQALTGMFPADADPKKDADERLRHLRDQARAIEEGARAGAQLANAFGIIDDKSAAALQNTTQLATSLIRIAGKDWSAIPSAIASLASLISGAAGSAERMQLVESQTALIRALDRLRDAVLQDITAAEKERLVSQGGSILAQAEKIDAEFQRRGGGSWKVGDLSPEALAVIREIEQHLPGVEILKDGKIDMEAFREAMRTLEEMDLGLFADNLMGQLDGLDWLFRTIGDDALTAAEKLARFLAVLQDNGAGDFATEFQRIIDEQGAEAAQAWLDSLVEGLVGDAGSLLGKGGIFDGLTAEQARRILEQAGGYLSGSGLVASGRPETRMAVNITATQADELLRVESTSLYVEQQQLAQLIGIHSLIAQMVSAPPPSFGAIPDISPPSPASLGLGGMQQMMTDLSGMTVEVHVAGEGITPGNARDVGQRIGAGIGAGLDDRLRQAYRGSGASGPARVRVEA